MPQASAWRGGECRLELLVRIILNVPGVFPATPSSALMSPCRKDIPQEGPDVCGALHR